MAPFAKALVPVSVNLDTVPIPGTSANPARFKFETITFPIWAPCLNALVTAPLFCTAFCAISAVLSITLPAILSTRLMPLSIFLNTLLVFCPNLFTEFSDFRPSVLIPFEIFIPKPISIYKYAR